MTTQELTCQLHDTPTRLACAGCGVGICPKCMTRTPVGFKCTSCVGRLPRRSGRARLLPIAGVVLVVLVIVVAGIVALRPTHRTSPSTVGAPGPPGGPASTTPAAEPMLGDEVHDGPLTFVVTDFSCGAKALQIGGSNRSAEGKFCQLRVTAHNTGRGPATLLGQFQYLLDVQSKTYGPDLGLSQALADNGGRSLSQLNVNPDIAVALVLIYDVPDGLDPVEAQLRGSGGSRFGIRVSLRPRS